MNSQQQQDIIVKKTLEQLRQSLTLYSQEIVSQFQNAFDELDQVYKRKYAHKQREIEQQKESVERWKKIMDDFNRKTQLIMTDMFGLSSLRLQNRPLIQNMPISSQNEINPIVSNHPAKVSNEQKQMKVIQQKRKQSIRCSLDHNLLKVQLRPNVKYLKYIQFSQNRLIQFQKDEVDELETYDLSAIQSVSISGHMMEDQTLEELTKLEWKNLRSLQIDDNLITDITPLKYLNLNQLEDLDVSLNPLKKLSAEFLAANFFKQLVYLTISFDTGLDEICWQIMLQNDMQNFPRLQALDICNSNQLSQSIKNRIRQCMKRKSIGQKQKASKTSSPYPQNYQIKISWLESKQVIETYTEDQMIQMNRRWVESVEFNSEVLKPIPSQTNKMPAAQVGSKNRGRGRGRGRCRGRGRSRGRVRGRQRDRLVQRSQEMKTKTIVKGRIRRNPTSKDKLSSQDKEKNGQN